MPSDRERLEDEAEPQKYKYARRKIRTSIDHDLIEIICVRVSKGNALCDVANSLCLMPATLNEWKRRGEVYLDTQSNPEWAIYGDLALGLRAAMGDYASMIGRKIHKDKEWFRNLKIAERRMPETYAVDPQGGSESTYDPDENFL